jgi:hypothetical protein
VVDWLLTFPVLWMAAIVFAASSFLAAGVFWIVTRLAVNDRASAIRAVDLLAATFPVDQRTHALIGVPCGF